MRENIKTQQRWRDAILVQKTSGLSIKDFCEQRDISRPSFFLWRKRLGMAKEAADTGLASLLVGKSRVSGSLPGNFMRLMPPVELGGTIRIETPNGYRVDAGQVGEGGLKSVLEMIRGL